MRFHKDYCRRGYYVWDTVNKALSFVEGEGPAGTEYWHSASCETPEMIKAYSLQEMFNRDRVLTSSYEFDEEDEEYIGNGHWVPTGKKLDQGPRYSRAMQELLFKEN